MAHLRDLDISKRTLLFRRLVEWGVDGSEREAKRFSDTRRDDREEADYTAPLAIIHTRFGAAADLLWRFAPSTLLFYSFNKDTQLPYLFVE